MRLVLTLLALTLGGLGCAERVPIEGAPCGCPTGYTCVGTMCVKGSGPGVGGSTGGAGPGHMMMPSSPQPDSGSPLPMVCDQPGLSPTRRLTPEEYRFTVLDLTGVELDAGDVPTELLRLGAAGPRPGVSPGLLESLLVTAEKVSQQAVARSGEMLPCTDPPGSNQCARAFVDGFGRRAFRRPLSVDEQAVLLKAFEGGRDQGGASEGARRVIEVALGSPQFLYRLEQGEPRERPGLTPVTTWELATRLSYLIWASMPDQTLLDAAASGRLATSEEQGRQIDRMVRDPRAHRTRIEFLERWLDVSAARLAPKPPDAVQFTPELREAMVMSARMTFAQQAWEQDQATLFEAPALWANRALARFYGFEQPGADFAPVRPTGDQRRFGILTYPALLAGRANGADSSPVARGVLFVEQVLCTALAPPPPSVNAVATAEQRPGTTTRDRLAQHVNDPNCSVCHQLFDPAGLGLENYDGYGAWRTHDSGQLVDASGRLLGTVFNGPDGLARLLGGHKEVTSCLAKQWFRYAFGRDDQPTDGCTIDQLRDTFLANGKSLQSLLRATVQTVAFQTVFTPGTSAP